MESLYESWAKRNPSWERRYQSTVVDVFCDYGKGVSSFLEARGKIFGAGYEIFIIAFFIGLYHNRTKPLIEDRDKKKVFGQAIQYWGNIENRIGRTSYGNIRREVTVYSPTGEANLLISKGLKPGETVVTAGVYQLVEGQRIKEIK